MKRKSSSISKPKRPPRALPTLKTFDPNKPYKRSAHIDLYENQDGTVDIDFADSQLKIRSDSTYLEQLEANFFDGVTHMLQQVTSITMQDAIEDIAKSTHKGQLPPAVSIRYKNAPPDLRQQLGEAIDLLDDVRQLALRIKGDADPNHIRKTLLEWFSKLNTIDTKQPKLAHPKNLRQKVY